MTDSISAEIKADAGPTREEMGRLRRIAAKMASRFGGGAVHEPKPAKVYSNVVAGSRAPRVGSGAPGWKVRWIAGDVPERGLFRKRRDALAECRAGRDDARPRLVLVSPGPFSQVFPAGTPRDLAEAAVKAYEDAHVFDLAGGEA